MRKRDFPGGSLSTGDPLRDMRIIEAESGHSDHPEESDDITSDENEGCCLVCGKIGVYKDGLCEECKKK